MTTIVSKKLTLNELLCEHVASSQEKQGWVAINLGCGKVKLDGFINIDVDKNSDADIKADLTDCLRLLADQSIDLIYSEHFWEHLSSVEASQLAVEAFRVLKPEGRMRIATVDLDYVVHKYGFDWQNQAWLDLESWAGEIKTRGQMLNKVMRAWGHQYLYNEEDLTVQLNASGFEDICRFSRGASSEERFWDLETRHDSHLILEGIKHDVS